MKSNIFKKVLAKPYKLFLRRIDKKAFSREKNVNTILVGSPRSGTTWFLDILSRYRGFCSLYEPLHYRWFPEAYQSGFRFRRRLKAGDEHSREERYIRKVVNGKIHSKEPRIFTNESYTNLVDELIKRINSKKIIAKFVRGGRMLGWMMDLFEEMNFVCLIRNPYAVIKSQIENRISGHLKSFQEPYEQLIVSDRISDITLAREIYELDNKYIKKCKNVLKDDSSLLAKLSITWAADNVILLEDVSDEINESKIVFYDDFVRMDRPRKLDKLDELGFAISNLSEKRIIQLKYLTKNNDMKDKLYSWKKFFHDEEIDRIKEIVEYIGDAKLDKYTSIL